MQWSKEKELEKEQKRMFIWEFNKVLFMALVLESGIIDLLHTELL